jgi:hypothetical protein
MMRFLAGALFVVSLASELHAQLPKGITSETDKFLKKEFQSTGVAALDAPSMFDGKITIRFSRLVNEPPVPSILSMSVAYRHSEWAFIEGGYSLMVKADSLVFDLKAVGSPRRDVERGTGKVDEYVTYMINPCRVLQMQSAKAVEFRFIGKTINDRVLSKDARKLVDSFAELVATDTSRWGGCTSIPR